MKNPIFLFLFIAIGALTFSACQSSEERAKAVIVDKYKEFDSTYVSNLFKNEILSGALIKSSIKVDSAHQILNSLRTLYSSNGNQLIWQELTSGQLDGQAELVQQIIAAAGDHGLSPAHYGLDELKNLIGAEKTEENTDIRALVAHRAKIDALISAAALAYSRDMFEGRLKTQWEIPAKTMDYAAAFGQAISDGKITEYFQGLRPRTFGYEKLVAELARLKKVKTDGGFSKVPTKFSYSKGKSGEAISALIARLKMSDALPSNFNGDKLDDEVLSAVKKFQSDNGIPNTGNIRKQTLAALNKPVEEIIQQVILNLDRQRWLPQEMEEEFVWVNIPDCTVDYYRDGKSILDMIVVVGDPKSPTPVFREDMTHVIFSPAWNVPMSIAKEEILNYIHINPNLLIVAEVDVFHKGKKLDNPLSVKWTPELVNSRDYTFRVRPGGGNSLGDVKFMFPNHHSVYMHDTNSKECFDESVRTLSAGCIRVHKPVDLARVILEEKGGWDNARIKRNMGLKREQVVYLPSEIPVYLYYLTAWVDDTGKLQLRKDYYRHDKKQLAKWDALNKSA